MATEREQRQMPEPEARLPSSAPTLPVNRADFERQRHNDSIIASCTEDDEQEHGPGTREWWRSIAAQHARHDAGRTWDAATAAERARIVARLREHLDGDAFGKWSHAADLIERDEHTLTEGEQSAQREEQA